MSRLSVTFASGHYDRMAALKDGSVVPEGLDLTCLTLPIEEIFWRMIRFKEFDACEMSLSSYSIGLSRGSKDFIAIPVFPSFYFRHGFIFVNAAGGIQSASDLKGRRIGVPEYQMTAPVWMRGMLQDDYGVRTTDVTWVTGGQEQPGRQERHPLTLPPEIRLEKAPAGRTLNEMLLAGEIDALFAARIPSIFLQHPDRIVRLFPNYREVEEAYYRRTGIMPPMHTVVVRRELHDRNPWVAVSLYKACIEAKAQAIENMFGPPGLGVSLPFAPSYIEDTRAVFGDDWWPYGLEANRKALETLQRYLSEQGLTSAPIPVEELFAPSTLNLAKI